MQFAALGKCQTHLNLIKKQALHMQSLLFSC